MVQHPCDTWRPLCGHLLGWKPSEYLTAATRAAAFIHSKLYDADTCRLMRSFRESPSAASGFIDDYAFLIAGLLELFQAGGDVAHLHWAIQLQNTQVKRGPVGIGIGLYKTRVFRAFEGF